MYTGKEICQGCKKTAKESPKIDKNSLCSSCNEIYKQGKAEITYKSIGYVSLRQFIHAYYDSVTWDDKGYITDFMIEVIKGFDNPSATSEKVSALKNAFGDNCIYGTIPKPLYEPLKKLCLDLEKVIAKYRKDIEEIPSKAAKEVQKEKDRIYNEGIKKGQDLLFALNRGDITMSDFEKNLTYKNE